MYLILALLLQVAPIVDVAQPLSAEEILSRVKMVNKAVQDWSHIVESRFAKDLKPPKVGVLAGSAPKPGADGLHAFTVLGVHEDSPAMRAGIRPGDRILRVDERRLEHETVTVVYRIMDNKPGPVRLTVQRGQEIMEFTVQRESLSCLAEAADLVDQQHLRDQITEMLNILKAIRQELEQPNVSPESLDVARIGVGMIAYVFEHVVSNAVSEIHKATVAACKTSFG